MPLEVERLVAICCPQLLDEGERGVEVRHFAAVLEVVEELCPWVTPVRLGICTIPARGPSRLLGGEAAVVGRLVTGVRQLGHEVQVGVAPGLFGALQAARAGLVVPDAELSGFLAALPLEVLGRDELTGTLARLGVRTLGQLARLDPGRLHERFGPDALLCHRVATGHSGELAGLRDPAVLRRLRQVVGRSEAMPAQPDFYGGADAGQQRAAQAAIRLQAKLGSDKVLVARQRGARDPSARGVLVPWGSEPVAEEHLGAPWPGGLPAPSPSSVLARPIPAVLCDAEGVEVIVTARGLLSRRPARCSIGGDPFVEVGAWAGPWPLTERWWSTGQRRARLQVVTTDQVALLLGWATGRWFLDALYD